MKRPTRPLVWAALLGTILAGLPAVAASAKPSAGPTAACPWLNQRLPIDTRVNDVVRAMTVDEKLSLLWLPRATSATDPYSGYQRYLAALPRLCVPDMTQQDGPSGVAGNAPGVTGLPTALAAGATWDSRLVEQYGRVIGSEDRAKGVTVNLGPAVDIVRVPQWGRAMEEYGEDPYLNGVLGAADVKAVQSQGVISNLKHFTVYNQETYRQTPADNVQVDPRTLREIYLAPFENVVKTAHPGSVMCAFPLVNNVWNCQNGTLMNGILRNEWGFKGFIRTDSPAPVTDGPTALAAGLDQESGDASHFAPATLKPLIGTKITMAEINGAVSHILYPMFQMGQFNRTRTGSITATVGTPAHAAVAQRIAEQGTVLLKNVRNVLPLRGRGSVAVIGSSGGMDALTSGGGSGHTKASQISTPGEAITKRSPGTTYTMGDGPYSALPDLRADFTARFFPNATWSGNPTVTTTPKAVGFTATGSPTGTPAWSAQWTTTLTPTTTGTHKFSLTCDRACTLTVNDKPVITNTVQTYQQRYTFYGSADLTEGTKAEIKVSYLHPAAPTTVLGDPSPGLVELGETAPGVTPPSITRAVQAAKHAKTAVVFVGEYQSEGFDRPGLELPGIEDQLIEAVAKANPHTIVVLNTGGPVLMPWLDKVSSVLEAWYPGQQDGAAIASVLYGDTSPGGKLPVTFPASETATPVATPARYPGVDGKVSYSEGLNVGYRWYDTNHVTPLFPFGYGLSYTSFAFTDLTVHRDSVTANVTNTGSREGTDVAQLYVTFPPAAGEPPLQLKGFVKVDLRPGRRTTVTFPITTRDLSYWDTTTNAWTLAPGSYQVHVGDSSADLPLQTTWRH